MNDNYYNSEDDYESSSSSCSSSMDSNQKISLLKLSSTSSRRKQSKPVRLDQQLKTPNVNISTHDNEQVVKYTKKEYEYDELDDEYQKNQTQSKQTHLTHNYCYICKKEYCNKYFLKTHLSNKHGLTLDDEQLQVYLLEKKQQQQDSKENICLINDSTSLSSSTQDVSSTSTSTMKYEDFCELCQKQFCNKYYLRKHKYDVHGIKKSSCSTSFTHSCTSTSLTSSNEPSTHTLVGNPLLATILSPQINTDIKVEPSVVDEQEKKLSSLIKQETVSCDLCEKIFFNKEYLKLHLNNRHGKPLTSDSNTLGNNNNNNNNKENSRLNDSLSSSNTQVKISASDTAHCEFCNKTFCNKYFLKTHIARIHVNRRQEKEQQQHQQHQQLNDNESTYKVYCDICNKAVCNKYFLKTHKLKIHGIHTSNVSSLSTSSPVAFPTLVIKSSGKGSLTNSDDGCEDESECEDELIIDENGKRSRTRSIESNESKRLKMEYDDSDLSIQPFFIESNDSLFNSLFKPCMIYLPVKCKLNESISLNLTLKPLAKS